MRRPRAPQLTESGRIHPMNLPMLTRRNNVRVMVSLCMLASGAAFAAAPAWQANVLYTAGTQVTYNGATYSALVTQDDYSGTGWTPTTASLWTLVAGSSTGTSGSSG